MSWRWWAAVRLFSPDGGGGTSCQLFTRWVRLPRNERVRQGISQDRLAEISGLNQKTISRLESCIYATSVDTIERIAFALRIDADQLLRKAEAGPADP